MKRFTTLIAAILMGVAACGTEEEESSMAGMTAEEHARMQAGGTQGALDSMGAAVRQPVHLTPAQERALGVVYTTARREALNRTVRTVGQITTAEPGLADITPKVEGYVERLYVDYTGATVRRGDPLLSLYSPMLVAAQQELLTALRLATAVDSGAGEAWQQAQHLLAASRRRLAYWDISQEQIDRIERSGEVTKTLTLVAPFDGVVLEKMVVEGQQVMPGMRLYRLANLSTVWVEGEVFEQDLRFVRLGTPAHIEVAAYAGEHWMGRVSFVQPTVDERSRTTRIRISVPNGGLRLKPGMYATIYFDVTVGPDALVVPREAVVATGERNLVFVRDVEGMLVPREVVLGARAGDRVQILKGLEEGETLVASANFLVDAESRLATTGGNMPGMQHGAEPAAPAGEEPRHD